jgi:predicted SAM-dependent methyltransferase
MPKKLLVLGDNPKRIAEEFPDHELQTSQLLVSSCQLDTIYASLVLQYVPYREVVAALEEWARLLKPRGQLYITVPSLEWAATQIISGKPLPVIMPFIYGNQGGPGQFYQSGFMLAALRNLVVAAGFEVREAGPFDATVQMGDEEYKVQQLLVLAVKPAKRKRKHGRKR